MSIKSYLKLAGLLIIATMCFNANADNIDAGAAHVIANNFLKQHAKNSPVSFNAPSTSDIRLVHAEPSSKVTGSNVYYVFNINGGGFIIIAGDDRASQVLGYSDKGKIDYNHMPEPLHDLLNNYKYDIEYLQTHQLNKSELGIRQSLKNGHPGVEPMTVTSWGQETPYDMLTPTVNGNHCKVGCAGVCMSQMIYFWKYPLSVGQLEPYYASYINDTVPGLPATEFDYSLMLKSYCHWDWDNTRTIQDTYTTEQALEVAKLCRYVGQATQMNYSIDWSGTTGERKLATMKLFGYNPNATTIQLYNYNTATWENLIRDELDAGRPVMYAAYCPAGHAFIVDGYDNEGLFHVNMGWYGTNDGWYHITAITLVNRYGEYRDYSLKNNMILNMEPPVFCASKTSGIDADNDLIVLGGDFNPQASAVYLYTSHRTLDLLFTLTDANGNDAATSTSLPVIRHTYEQGSDISLPITLPTTLPSGIYDLNFGYRTDGASPATLETAAGKLFVTGKFAKYNANFNVSDVTTAIGYVLNGSPSSVTLNVADITALISYILNQ